MTTGTKTKICKSLSYFGEKCKESHGHTKRHTWDTNDYRRRKKEAVQAEGPWGPDMSKLPATGTPKGVSTGQIIDVVISFDTTGSMSSCIAEVRRNVSGLVKDLFKDIPDLRIGIIAHGDYCDAHNYVTKHEKLTREVEKLTRFVETVPNTGGGDAPECYELVLHEARTMQPWEKGRNKVLVMIGDATPHPVGYHANRKRLDWKVETRKLAESGVAVYSVQCLRYRHGGSEANRFWEAMPEISGGHHLVLDDFANIRDLLKAVCYKQQGEEVLREFVRTVEHSGRMTEGMSKVYSTLLGREIGSDGAEAEGAKAIDPSRFIVFKVTKDEDIRAFVKRKRKTFRKGCGFYQFQKTVKVQDHKEIVLLEEETGDLFGGREARRILGFPASGTIEVNPKRCAALQDGRYTAFVQSTSVNRKLLKGTKLLYENEHWDG